MVLILTVTVYVALDTDWGAVRQAALADQARLIGQSLINEYVLPFEIGAVLLTAALVGAIALARQGPRGRGDPRDEHGGGARWHGRRPGADHRPTADRRRRNRH